MVLDPHGDSQIDPNWVIYNKGAEIVQTMNRYNAGIFLYLFMNYNIFVFFFNTASSAALFIIRCRRMQVLSHESIVLQFTPQFG